MKLQITENDIRTMVQEIVNQVTNPLRLEIGYNYHTTRGNIRDLVIFHVMYNDESVAEWLFDGDSPIPNKITVNLRLDNLSDEEKEIVISALNGGPTRSYAYDDAPEEVYQTASADIKPFICRNLTDAVIDFMNNKQYPQWQRDRAWKVINSAQEENWIH